MVQRQGLRQGEGVCKIKKGGEAMEKIAFDLIITTTNQLLITSPYSALVVRATGFKVVTYLRLRDKAINPASTTNNITATQNHWSA